MEFKLKPQKRSAKFIACLAIKVITVSILGTVFSASVSHARLKWEPNDAELRMLPKYCTTRIIIRKDTSNEDVKKYYRIFGKDWDHMHHFCGGLANINRARASMKPAEKKQQYRGALSQMDYMLKYSSSNFFLRAKIHVLKGDIYLETGDVSQAVNEYHKAVAFKKDYEEGYIKLSIVALIYQKNPVTARKYLEIGLRHKPNSKKLKAALKQIF